MRVLLVNTTELGGGAAIAANRLMQAFHEKGVEAKMLVCKKQTDNSDVVALKPRWRYTFHFLRERLGIFLSNGCSRKNLFAVDTAVTGTDITQLPVFREADIIHLHWVNQGMLSLENLEKILATGKPVVWTLHDMWPFTGICHYANDCTQYQEACRECPMLRFPVFSSLAKNVFQKKKAVFQKYIIHFVAVSSWLKGCAQGSSLLPQQSVQVIPNALSLERYKIEDKQKSREYFSLSQDRIILVFGAVKLEEKRKGLTYLNQALSLLIQQGRYQREQFLLVMFGGIKQTDILQEIPVPYQLMGYIKEDRDLSMLYSAADVAVIPSMFETFGQTVIEAQACGCTPVTFTGSGQMDIIDHKMNGYLADYMSVTDFAEGINWAIHHPVDSYELRRGVEGRYAEQIVADEYIQLYQQIQKEEKV